MILGVGIDLLKLKRIEDIYSKFQDKALEKVLSYEEINFLKNNKKYSNKIENFLAKRFSVKESFLKAIGIGMGRGIDLVDISVINDSLGKPEIFLNKKAVDFIEKKYNVKINNVKIDVSISDDDCIINSIVIISLIQ